MRLSMLSLALVMAITGCNADRSSNDTASTPKSDAPTATPNPLPAPTPTRPPDTPPPSDSVSTVPSRFQGRYATDAAACANPAHESRLTIESSRITFHESSGPITRVAQGPTEVSITAQLTGEGETREASYSFRLSDDGNTLTDVGNGGARERCS